nr:TetR/AcrR family transcriptional regulator [uncultured Flavobacterium sp.]
MKGRPNIHNDEQLILKAQEIFWQQGYSATSLSDLTTATGAGAGSLYNIFKGGKKELFKRALQQRREDLRTFRQQLETSETPIELIKNFFLEIANADKKDHYKGCIVANTVVEMTFIDEELKNEAISILNETEQMYTRVIATAQQRGLIKDTIPADVLGKYLISFWCGINSLRRIYPERETLVTQIKLQLKILE